MLIDSEASEIGVLALHSITLAQPPAWINEKLLHLHGVLGSETRIELVVDVEANSIVFAHSK